jgi:hypothetical protein
MWSRDTVAKGRPLAQSPDLNTIMTPLIWSLIEGGSIMAAEGSNQRSVAEPQGLDEIEASISAIENAVLNSYSAEPRQATRELGCFIVAQALGIGTPGGNKPASRVSSLTEREARFHSAGMRDDYGDAWRGKTRSKLAGGRAYAAHADLKPLQDLAALLARHAARVTRRAISLFALLKPQRYWSSPAWRWSNSSIDSQDPIDAALVPPPKRSSDIRHTLTALPALPELGPLLRREPCPCMPLHSRTSNLARLEGVASTG